jgi:exopolysaccharide production protein ExoQ
MNGVNRRESGDALAGQPTFFENVFIITVLFYSTSAFSTFLKGTSDLPEGAPRGSLVTNTIWIVIYIVALYLLYSRSNGVRLALRKNLPLILILVVSVGSLFWSDAPQLTILHSGALVGTTIVGMYFGLRFTLIQQLRLLALMFGIAASLSIVFCLFLPAHGIGAGVFEGFWQGIYPHKNTLGNNMAMAFTVFMVLGASTPAYRWIKFLFAGVALVLVILADSVTSLFVCMTILCVLLLFRFFRQEIHRRRRYFLGFSVVVVVAVAFCVSNFSEILSLVGRGEDMSGRFLIWSLVWTAISTHPLLGHGYGAFWRGLEGPSADLWDALGSQFLFHAHNGFLDIWLDIGLLGLGVFLIGYIYYLRRSWLLFFKTVEPELIWPVLFMTFLLLSDLTEAAFLRANATSWILYTSNVFSLVRWPQEQAEPLKTGRAAQITPATAFSFGSQT